MNGIIRSTPAFGPTVLGLIVAMSMGCSDSGTTVLDGQPPSDAGVDYLVYQDTQPTDTQPADTQPTETQLTDAQLNDAQLNDAQLNDAQATDTAQPQDAIVPSDGSTGFPQALDGIWLVGWIGGLNRFSWVRFSVTSKTGGTAIINKGALTGGTVPYWSCSGSTTWNITSKPNTIQLHYPSATCTGMKSESFTFTSISPFSGSYPKGAQFKAAIQASGSTPATVSGYKFPLSQCDATLTTCKDPL
jgi:hypothetical protein